MDKSSQHKAPGSGVKNAGPAQKSTHQSKPSTSSKSGPPPASPTRAHDASHSAASKGTGHGPSTGAPHGKDAMGQAHKKS